MALRDDCPSTVLLSSHSSRYSVEASEGVIDTFAGKHVWCREQASSLVSVISTGSEPPGIFLPVIIARELRLNASHEELRDGNKERNTSSTGREVRLRPDTAL